jgi:SAM-dependent methyltransferase
MLAQLHRRAAAESIDTAALDVREGDAQSLPWPDASFDAGFSMFGLMFFPDRARGLTELHRVLVPGGRAVVSSWQPMSLVPPIATVAAALAELVPGTPPPPARGPMTDPDDVRAELAAAGFTDVAVHAAAHAMSWPSTTAMAASMERTFVPIVLARRRLGEAAFAPVAAGLRARLEAALGAGPQRIDFPAWLGVGVA